MFEITSPILMLSIPALLFDISKQINKEKSKNLWIIR